MIAFKKLKKAFTFQMTAYLAKLKADKPVVYFSLGQAILKILNHC